MRTFALRRHVRPGLSAYLSPEGTDVPSPDQAREFPSRHDAAEHRRTLTGPWKIQELI